MQHREPPPQAKRHRISPVLLSRSRELRRPQTPAEARLWAHLCNRQLAGHKFRRQHPIGSYVVDFCCLTQRLVIEIDGDSHTEQVDYDRVRTEWLREAGYRVIRFTNADVREHLDAVVDAIRLECEKRLK